MGDESYNYNDHADINNNNDDGERCLKLSQGSCFGFCVMMITQCYGFLKNFGDSDIKNRVTEKVLPIYEE